MLDDLIGELKLILGYDVGLDDKLLVEGGLDSFGIMQVIAYLEMRHKVLVPLEEVEIVNFSTARTISDWVLCFPAITN